MVVEVLELTWDDIHTRCAELAGWITVRKPWRTGVYGVPRGGLIPAAILATRLGVPQLAEPDPGCLVVDDLVDSGRTAERFAGHPFVALYRKDWSPVLIGTVAISTSVGGAWVRFPWETEGDSSPQDAAYRLLQTLGWDTTDIAAQRLMADVVGLCSRNG